MNPNELLAEIESARLWGYFHKDWLLQIRAALRPQLPPAYHVFVESESILISPDDEIEAVTLPDVSVARRPQLPAVPQPGAIATGTAATIEVDEPCEIESRYSLVIRRSPDHFVTAVCELVSPSNRGVGNRLDREQHLRKRIQLLDAGVNMLEIDTLVRGERILPDATDDLARFPRTAWTVFHEGGMRRWRGWGWNDADPLPGFPWRVDTATKCFVDLAATFAGACEFNDWERIVRE